MEAHRIEVVDRVRTARGILTPMQACVLAEHASGKRMSEIGPSLHISYGTVISHAAEARARLGAKTLAAACVRAYALGYIVGPTGTDGKLFPAI